MEIGEKEVVGVGAALFGWLGGVWTVARKVTKFQENTTTTLEAHAKQITKNTEEIEKLREHHDADLDSVRNFFSTSAGGQKFMTFPDHDLACLRNNKVILAELQHLTAAVKVFTEQSAETGKQVSQMAVDIAVMKVEMNKQ